MPNTKFRSLRIRLLAPLLGTLILAVGVLAGTSFWLGSRWAHQEVTRRLEGIRETLAGSSFPLTEPVLRLLADLTGTELISCGASGAMLAATLPSPRAVESEIRRHVSAAEPPRGGATEGLSVTIRGERYLAFAVRRRGPTFAIDGVASVWVLFPDEQFRATRFRAAMLPLMTGLSAAVLIGALALTLTGRLVRRLGNLESRVAAVAAGDFESTVSDDVDDEVGRLGGAVDSMSGQLKRLWRAIERRRGEELLHQIAGGMAHQLRNSLTGARMAIELHADRCPSDDAPELPVAIRQIEVSEDYVRRLLLVGAGKQDEDRPASAAACLDDVASSLQPIANHLRVELNWQLPESLAGDRVADGPTFTAAVTNLVLNALQAGSRVDVMCQRDDDAMLRVSVADDGPGITAEIADELFEPFVTSKPEGLGLGLPLVRRSAEVLGGGVKWSRREGLTVFELTVPVEKTH